MLKKICKKCNIEYDIVNFNKNIRKSDGREIYCKDCSKEMCKIYYNNNKEKVLEKNKKYSKTQNYKNYQSAWRKQNKDKCREYSNKYRSKAENKEKNKETRLKNKEKERKRERERYSKNPELFRQKNKLKRLKNIDDYRLRERIYSHKRRCLLKSNEGSEIYTSKDIKTKIETQKFKCIYCLKSIREEYHIDHIKPISKGGPDCLDNIQILCPTCNIKKSNKDPIVFANENGRLL